MAHGTEQVVRWRFTSACSAVKLAGKLSAPLDSLADSNLQNAHSSRPAGFTMAPSHSCRLRRHACIYHQHKHKLAVWPGFVKKHAGKSLVAFAPPRPSSLDAAVLLVVSSHMDATTNNNNHCHRQNHHHHPGDGRAATATLKTTATTTPATRTTDRWINS